MVVLLIEEFPGLIYEHFILKKDGIMRSRTNWINGCKKLWLKVRLSWKVNVHSTKPKKTRTYA